MPKHVETITDDLEEDLSVEVLVDEALDGVSVVGICGGTSFCGLM